MPPKMIVPISQETPLNTLNSLFMRSLFGIVVLSFYRSAAGFVPTLNRQTSLSGLSSYLDSLSTNHVINPPTPQVMTDVTDTHTQSSSFYHAPKSYFSLSNLTDKGPRKADVGTPHEGTRKLVQLDHTRAGSWSCSSGGWPSPNPKAHTEIFLVWDGHGCLSDSDGVKHYFGPGDTVIIPKGHTGRWDVLADMHKIWFVNDHENVEESDPIRVRVIHYHDLVSMENQVSFGVSKDVVRGNPEIYSNVFYKAGNNNVGSWVCTPGCFNINGLDTTIGFYVLEGLFYITDAESGQCCRCGPGDTVMLPKGWSGCVDVVETAKKLWTNYLSS